MKILIISDIHGNKEALEAIDEEIDYILCLGDLVDYGPNSEYVIDFIKFHADYIVKGNHDHAVGFNTTCKCAKEFRLLSEATRKLVLKSLPEEKIEYLRYLPVTQKIDLPGHDFFLVHAAPSNPLYFYLNKDDKNTLEEEAKLVDCNYIFIGHNHKQWKVKVKNTEIISPGSIGMSKDNPGFATYAIWEDGKTYLKKVRYDLKKTLKKIDKMPLTKELKESLKSAFRFGKP